MGLPATRPANTQIDLFVTDGHDGLLAAVKELFSATPRQRCLVHKQRNILNAVPRRERGDVQADLVGIWDQPGKQEAVVQLNAFKAKYSKRYPEAVRSLAEEEEKTLAFYEFPQSMHRHLQTTNAIESLFSNVRQRTDQIDAFTTETSCLTIVLATTLASWMHLGFSQNRWTPCARLAFIASCLPHTFTQHSIWHQSFLYAAWNILRLLFNLKSEIGLNPC